jgi:hypothetical protein
MGWRRGESVRIVHEQHEQHERFGGEAHLVETA